MTEPYRLKPRTRAYLRVASCQGLPSEHPARIAADARLAYHWHMTPQVGAHPIIDVAWQREAGTAGYYNRHIRRRIGAS